MTVKDGSAEPQTQLQPRRDLLFGGKPLSLLMSDLAAPRRDTIERQTIRIFVLKCKHFRVSSPLRKQEVAVRQKTESRCRFFFTCFCLQPEDNRTNGVVTPEIATFSDLLWSCPFLNSFWLMLGDKWREEINEGCWSTSWISYDNDSVNAFAESRRWRCWIDLLKMQKIFAKC